MSAGAALFVLAPTATARPTVASVWAAPTYLSATGVRLGELSGGIEAYRTGVGDGSAHICLHMWKQTLEADGSDRFDVISGCRFDAKNSAYLFDPVRWKGEIAVSVPLQAWTHVVHADGTITEPSPRSLGDARVRLHWAGRGTASLRPYSGTSYATLHAVYVGFTATKRASVDGTITIGRDVIRVARGAGVMRSGGEV